ncbi:MAG: hypothetical protein HY360_05810 [Verrucomicrobia bacterium]|nr:hypothetical protein [Verrucomicrobiota bacterium]
MLFARIVNVGCGMLMMIVGTGCALGFVGAGFADAKTAINLMIGVHLIAFVVTFIMLSVFGGARWKWLLCFIGPGVLLGVGFGASLVAEGKSAGAWLWLAAISSLSLAAYIGACAGRRFWELRRNI